MSEPASRQERIQAFQTGAARVRTAWESVPAEARDFRPAAGEWSPHEIVIHLADGDVNGYVRFRKLVTEPGSTVVGYEQDDWANGLDYASQDPVKALALMELVRELTYPILTSLPEAVWGHTVTHTERGTWSMDDWLATYANHVDAHLRQMEETVGAWRAASTEPGAQA